MCVITDSAVPDEAADVDEPAVSANTHVAEMTMQSEIDSVLSNRITVTPKQDPIVQSRRMSLLSPGQFKKPIH